MGDLYHFREGLSTWIKAAIRKNAGYREKDEAPVVRN